MENTMTHYMELLATNQPWNLIIFMAIPVIFAEFIAVTELFILLNRDGNQSLRRWNKIAGIIIGIYFTGVFFYLFTTAVIPLTMGGGWRGIADVIAVGFYLLGIVPLGGMALMGLGLIGKNLDEPAQLKLHATLVAVFLVVAHVAMIFGMLDPTLFTGNSMPM
ncbi:MAG: hypothetical protein KA473_10945 [Anaerolineales bacterium]|nr:hypothetical protein [Anaerolineales bacterium]MBP6209941.1 hypothetical protein [Anaerolineales bacterium]